MTISSSENRRIDIPPLNEKWKKLLNKELNSDYFFRILEFLEKEKSENQIVYPEYENIFSAFNHRSPENLKTVIIGQDPYHGENQAHGLCFSVKKGIKPPPSLVNIFKELKTDIGFSIPNHGELLKWSEQGVLLLNAVLTVRGNQANSHKDIGWGKFTDAVIKTISNEKEGIVFLLWGRFAQTKSELIDDKKHFILKATHPSPFSANNGFFGCRHFSTTNEILKSINKKPIDWQL
ncbi:MAG: uracil-DNA glycosylase [Bacteroidota bacterium]|nr:uracil-DNA glycosylase [Bacteroidota bacterium]